MTKAICTRCGLPARARYVPIVNGEPRRTVVYIHAEGKFGSSKYVEVCEVPESRASDDKFSEVTTSDRWLLVQGRLR